MTKGKSKLSQGKVLDFDHLVFWVGNATTASSYFVSRFGFELLAFKPPSEEHQVLSIAVRLNKITILFESPTSTNTSLNSSISSHGDFVKDVAFAVEDLDTLVSKAKEGGAEVLEGVQEVKDERGKVRKAVLKTYGDNTHTLIDRKEYKGVFLPGFKAAEIEILNSTLPPIPLKYIDHVEANLSDGALEDAVSWYQKTLNLHRFWCVDYNHDLVPWSCINSASVVNKEETILLSMNEAAKGLRPSSKATDFLKAHGTSGVEHVALNTDDIVTTMRNLKSRGAEIVTWPPTYYDIIREKLKNSSLNVTESIDVLQELNILIDFDERGYMLQAFTKHLQPRPTLFLEVIQRKNHRGFGAMNYKWVFEAIELLDKAEGTKCDAKPE